MSEIILKYKGPNVDDGSMPIEDMICALKGFSSAYKNIVNHQTIEDNVQHRLIVKQIRQGSCDIIIDAIQIAQDTATIAIPIIKNNIKPAVKIVKTIIDLIKLTKHTKNEKFTINIKGDNNKVTVVNKEGDPFLTDKETFEIYDKKLIAKDLVDLTRPLSENCISSASILIIDDCNIITEEILAADKKYFTGEELEEETFTTTQMKIQGEMVSLNKNSNMGIFKIVANGKSVSYKLVMPEPENQYHYFTHKGILQVECTCKLDKHLEIKRIDITKIDKLQLSLWEE